MRNLSLVILMVGILCQSAFSSQKRMPLPDTLFQAKSVYIDNQTPDCPECADQAYQELSEWGRFKVVSDPKNADLLLVLTSTSSMRPIGVVANTTSSSPGSAQTNGTVVERQDYTVYLAVVDAKTNQQLYRNVAYWRFAWSKPAKGLIKDLRKRMEEQEHKARK